MNNMNKDTIKNRIKEITSELAYIRRMERCCVGFGYDEYAVSLWQEREDLRNKLKHMKNNKEVK